VVAVVAAVMEAFGVDVVERVGMVAKVVVQMAALMVKGGEMGGVGAEGKREAASVVRRVDSAGRAAQTGAAATR
jgi:hypothetical protein